MMVRTVKVFPYWNQLEQWLALSKNNVLVVPSAPDTPSLSKTLFTIWGCQDLPRHLVGALILSRNLAIFLKLKPSFFISRIAFMTRCSPRCDSTLPFLTFCPYLTCAGRPWCCPYSLNSTPISFNLFRTVSLVAKGSIVEEIARHSIHCVTAV